MRHVYRLVQVGIALGLVGVLQACSGMYKYTCKGDGSVSTGVNSNEAEVDKAIKEAEAKGMTCTKESPKK